MSMPPHDSHGKEPRQEDSMQCPIVTGSPSWDRPWSTADFEDFSTEWMNELEKSYYTLWRGELHWTELWSILKTFLVACRRFKRGMGVEEFEEMRTSIWFDAVRKSLKKLKRDVIADLPSATDADVIASETWRKAGDAIDEVEREFAKHINYLRTIKGAIRKSVETERKFKNDKMWMWKCGKFGTSESGLEREMLTSLTLDIEHESDDSGNHDNSKYASEDAHPSGNHGNSEYASEDGGVRGK